MLRPDLRERKMRECGSDVPRQNVFVARQGVGADRDAHDLAQPSIEERVQREPRRRFWRVKELFERAVVSGRLDLPRVGLRVLLRAVYEVAVSLQSADLAAEED